MKRFDIIELTADVGIIGYGTELAEAFANTAYGMFSLITDLNTVEEAMCQETTIQSEDTESLLVEWLNELLYLLDTKDLIFKRFDILVMDQTHLRSKNYGEKIDPAKHIFNGELKAATYHMLKIEKDNGYKTQVVFDM